MTDISQEVRTALLANSTLTALLQTYLGVPAVFNKTPAPDGSQYPMVIARLNDTSDEDGLNSDRPIIEYDIIVYGRKPEQYEAVETAAGLVRTQFHRQRFSLTVTGYNVVMVRCIGPRPAPTEDEALFGRMVRLVVSLQKTS